jgi:Histidine kinase-, DNA gyrase B-, and HSP90-like ATPase
MPASTELYEQTSLWLNAFAWKDDELDRPRDILRLAYQDFRGRVELLIGQIKSELPDLTLHDISHVDALWRVASEIAGEGYDLNPAEAFVLGGAFLLHDAAHCLAAFEHGLEDIRKTDEWRDAAAIRKLNPVTLNFGDAAFKSVLFEALRVLHPKRAEHLPFAVWGKTPSDTTHLLQQAELREAYGHVIGAIAKSHWSNPHELEAFARSTTNAPLLLQPASWTVNWLKLAVLLRTADALHMDAKRAPRFLMQIAPPQDAHSQVHWQFQARLNTVKRDADPNRQEIIITGSPFPATEQMAWWLAYDTARMADKELSAAHYLLRDHNLPALAVREISGIKSPEAFARHVPVQGWIPVDTEVRISQVQTLVENFGGQKLYGDEPRLALRELLQNAIDAVHACRALGGLDELGGEIEVSLEPVENGKQWLHVTDTGIGMSRYVLTNVLLDFGKSLWRSSDMRGEWSGLAATGFEAIGQFGIGFFSIFMLGEQVKVTTRRYEAKDSEGQWLLEFSNGTRQRPVLRVPEKTEALKRHGTRVSVLLTAEVLIKLLNKSTFPQVLGSLAPAIDIDLSLKDQAVKVPVIRANDWLNISAHDLFERINPTISESDGSPKRKVVLTEICDESGHRVGRVCAAPRRDIGVGVVKGLAAGVVHAINGLVFCKTQRHLSRSDATPNLNFLQLQIWSNENKRDLIAKNQLDAEKSVMLAQCGANHKGLHLGLREEDVVTTEGLAQFLNEADELLIHDRWIDLDEDESIPRSKHHEFMPAVNLLLTFDCESPNWFQMIGEQVISREAWSITAAIESAVQHAWGDDVAWEEEYVLVGHIDDIEINRRCVIARRASSQGI